MPVSFDHILKLLRTIYPVAEFTVGGMERDRIFAEIRAPASPVPGRPRDAVSSDNARIKALAVQMRQQGVCASMPAVEEMPSNTMVTHDPDHGLPKRLRLEIPLTDINETRLQALAARSRNSPPAPER